MRLTLLLLLCNIASAQSRIGRIEFFGTTGIDLASVRAALPVKEGDALPKDKTQIQQAVRRVLGNDPTNVAFVCCIGQGDSIIYIGLPSASSRSFAFNPKPTGPDRLPAAPMQLYQQAMKALVRAVTTGDAGEDDSTGYALSKNPALRSKELEIREYALANQPLLLRILESSSDASHREIAAHFLGYAEQSPQQLAALVSAVRDPDNNSTRALGVLANSSAQLAEQIDPSPFIDMLSSGTWSDRNKAGMLMLSLTQGRPTELLAILRKQSLDSLIEMGRWPSGHAYGSLAILGRMANIDETRLRDLISKGEIEEIFRAVQAR